MGATFPFPEPAWLAGWSDPVIDGMLDELDDDEWRRLYRRFLADDVRAFLKDELPDDWLVGMLPFSWHAFVRAGETLRRRNTKERRG